MFLSKLFFGYLTNAMNYNRWQTIFIWPVVRLRCTNRTHADLYSYLIQSGGCSRNLNRGGEELTLVVVPVLRPSEQE